MTPTRTIPAEEFEGRRRRAQLAAAQEGLDALLVWSKGGTSVDFYGDVLYLTNHHSPFPPNQDTPKWSARSYSCLVLPTENEGTLVIDLPTYPQDQIQIDDVRSTLHIPGTVARVLEEKGLTKGKLGLVGKDAFLLAHFRALQDVIGHSLLVEPADAILESLRSVKSEAELTLLRHAADVGVEWMRTMMEAVAPGRTEGDVVGEGLRYFASHGGFPYDVGIASGPMSKHFFGRIGIPSWDFERSLEVGDLVHIDAWGPVGNYYVDFVRSTVVGREPTGGQREVLEAAVAIIEHIISGLKPGVSIGELYDRGASWLLDNGFARHGANLAEAGTDFGQLFPAFGHGVGVGLEAPWIIEGEETIVRENMVLAIEVLVAKPDVGGAGYEENVIVTAEGCEVITQRCPTRWWN